MRLTRIRVAGVLAIAAATIMTTEAAAETPSPSWLTRPCAHEDSVNCYWDAGTQGNGGGHSFFAVRVGEQVCLLYGEDKYARHHNRCVPLP